MAINAGWNISYFSNSFRTFIFKLHNNCLGYNYMVARFVRNIDPYCSFCMQERLPEPEPETPLHIFYACPLVEPILNEFFAQYPGLGNNLRRSDYFGMYENENFTSATRFGAWILCTLVKYYIWETKLRKGLPNYRELRSFVDYELLGMTKVSIKMKNIYMPAINLLEQHG